MKKLFFWDGWYRTDRNIFLFFLTVVIISLLWLVYAMITGVDNVIHWEVIDNLERLKTSVHDFRVGNLRLDIPLDNFIVFQYFQGSNLTIQPVYAYIYLVFLTLSINLVMAILPGINKFWFYAGMGGFIGFMVLFNMGQINLFNQGDKSALIIILGLYLTAGYYFREFNPNIPVFKRFLVFTMISVVIAILFYFYAGVNRPFLYLANNGIYAPVIIAVLFILSVAHELIYGFLFLTTSASTTGSKHSLAHFIFISLIYILYVIITYLNYTRQIQWDIIYLNPFLILIVASVIGLWSFRKREELYREIFPFYPSGALSYLGFACITFITIAYVFSTGNDPMIEAFEDAILYSQIGFSILFFIYVIANFGPMIARNFRVVKVVYQSRIFPFFVFRLGGVLTAGFLFFQAEFFPYYQLLAGYYNQVGDLYLNEGQLDLAREYYERASDFEYQNHRSNYAMATIGRLQRDKLDEAYYFENSLLKRPTDYAYVNLSNIFLKNNQYFEGLFKLREGQEKFPYSAQILNNLGYFYSRTDIIDTAFYYFNLANNATRHHAVPEGNIYGLLAKSGLNVYLDSLEEFFDSRALVTNINRQAILNQLQRYDSALIDRDKDTIRNDVDFAALYNSGLNAMGSSDSSFFKRISSFGRNSGNGFYQNRLDVLKAMHDYLIHRTGESFAVLNNFAATSMNNHEYYRILGKLAIEQDQPELAVHYLEGTNIGENPQDRFYYALAKLESGNSADALSLMDELRSSGDPDIAALSEEYYSVLNFDGGDSPEQAGDEYLYLLARYHPQFQEDSVLERMIDVVENPEVKDLMRLEYMESLIADKKYEKAGALFSKVEIPTVAPDFIHDYRRIGYLLDLHQRNDQHFIENTGYLKMNDQNYLYDVLLGAIRQLASRDSSGLERKFYLAGTWDPFFEPGILEAVKYYQEIKGDPYSAYNLLIRATEINRYSVPLYKRMVDLTLDMGLTEYAMDGLEILRDLLTAEEYLDYEDQISSRIREKQDRSWGQ
ncbi:MAG: hypothetical protein KFF73_05720 [Cyclobacteriaceae bacterium]|nr:hypothetical protein [Cyclobacteriaceae bacterium]